MWGPPLERSIADVDPASYSLLREKQIEFVVCKWRTLHILGSKRVYFAWWG